MGKKVRIIIAGGRTFNNYAKLKDEVNKIITRKLETEPDTEIEIVSGKNKGAGYLGKRFAREEKYELTIIPLKWNNNLRNETKAIQNRELCDYAKQEEGILIVFWDGLSNNIRKLIELGRAEGFEVFVVPYKKGEDS